MTLAALQRVERATRGFLLTLLVALMISYAQNVWAEGSSQATPETVSPSPAVGASPTPASANTPEPAISSPPMVGPLQMPAPNVVDLAKLVPTLSELPDPIASLSKVEVSGIVSGIGIVQNHPVPGDFEDRIDASNAELILQKSSGVIQYYLQIGGYSIPTLGLAYVDFGNAINSLYGPLPSAYLKIAPNDSLSLMAGNLPTLIGPEYTFTFQNMNIERGLLWNQENKHQSRSPGQL